MQSVATMTVGYGTFWNQCDYLAICTKLNRETLAAIRTAEVCRGLTRIYAENSRNFPMFIIFRGSTSGRIVCFSSCFAYWVERAQVLTVREKNLLFVCRSCGVTIGGTFFDFSSIFAFWVMRGFGI